MLVTYYSIVYDHITQPGNIMVGVQFAYEVTDDWATDIMRASRAGGRLP